MFLNEVVSKNPATMGMMFIIKNCKWWFDNKRLTLQMIEIYQLRPPPPYGFEVSLPTQKKSYV